MMFKFLRLPSAHRWAHSRYRLDFSKADSHLQPVCGAHKQDLNVQLLRGGVWFGDLGILSLLFAFDVVLLVSSGHDPQHALGQLQVEQFEYLGALLMNNSRMKQEKDWRKSASSLVTRTLLRSVVVKNELSQKAKLSTYWSIYVQPSPIVSKYELWQKKTRCWIQANMRFICRVATLRP